MDYYKTMNEHYSNNNNGISDDISSLQGVISDLIKQGYLSYEVTIDGVHQKEMLIYEHIDPIEGKEDDMRAICLDKTNLHWGNVITLPDGRNYLSITRGDWNGAYLKYKLRELTDDARFTKEGTNTIKTIVANKGFYDETSFVNETTVFEDKELRAALIQYNPTTKSLVLFDDIFINDNHYKIVKIDDYTFKEYDEEYGVLQLVIIDTPFGKIVKNDNGVEIKGIVMNAKVKDKTLNSIARELICEYNQVKRGDYIDFTYDRDEKGTMVEETYLVINKPTMGKNYDISLMYLCENKVKLLTGNIINGVAETVEVPIYYENNRVRIDKVIETEFIRLEDSSYMVIVQHNDITKRIQDGKVKRLWIRNNVYDVTGTDEFTDGLLAIGLNKGQIDPNDDNTELKIANYNSQVTEIMGSVPQPPTSQIICASEVEELYKGYENEYYLQGASQGVIWGVDADWIALRQDGLRCWIKFNDLKHVGKTVVLTARYGDIIYTKPIMTTNL